MSRKTKFDRRRLAAIVADNLDEYAQRYLDALQRVEELKEQLLYVCRKGGFTPKDAPKTKMLAGELYEVLASRATRTVVDQAAAGRLRARMRFDQNEFRRLFSWRTVFEIRPDATRLAHLLRPRERRAFYRTFSIKKSGTRLTVRKRKSQSRTVTKSQSRKAA